MRPESRQFDVLICGGGPVGLVLGYMLARMGIKTCIVEQYDKQNGPMYGRACSLFPRTIEMLDQLDLLDEMNQIGFICRTSATYDRDGNVVTERGWHALFKNMSDSYLDYVLQIRLKYSEGIILNAYQKLGGLHVTGCVLKSFSINEKSSEGYRINASVYDSDTDTTKIFASKYLVGADGGRSTVRTLAGIPFRVESTELKWVRIDSVLKTDMPNAQQFGCISIESPTHGNVLWVKLDHGRARIGFALTAAMIAEYGDGLTQEQAMKEAKAAMAPFSVDFITVDCIGQGLADSYFAHDCVFLAGDACHTHSSGAGQGMNLGVHDAVNLGWKLGAVLRGWCRDEILQTYEEECRATARMVLDNDKTQSRLISGKVPITNGTSDTINDVNKLFTASITASAQFIVGLGISHKQNLINRRARSGWINTGSRGPDALLLSPGSRVGVRLFQLTKNFGAFWILIFAGHPAQTAAGIRSFRSYLDSDVSFTKHMNPDMARFMTIIAGTSQQSEEALGVARFGNAYYDADSSAHERYGIQPESGAVVVLRPDGCLAFATTLDNGEEIGSYFGSITGCPFYSSGANGMTA